MRGVTDVSRVTDCIGDVLVCQSQSSPHLVSVHHNVLHPSLTSSSTTTTTTAATGTGHLILSLVHCSSQPAHIKRK